LPLVSTLVALAALSPIANAGAAADADVEREGQQLFQQYQAAIAAQRGKLRGISMDVEIEAAVPNLSKSAKMRAVRVVSLQGEVTYRDMQFEGDATAKKEVIARYLHAEKEAIEKPQNVGVTPENYRFRYRGRFGSGDWQLHLFKLNPKHKRTGLFEGWLWLDAKTLLPVREQGVFVKNPSLWLKRISFVRDYEIHDGVAVPVRIDSSTLTRLVGTANLVIRYSNVAPSAAVSAERQASSP
jgi:hypothetical protein